MYGIEMLVNEHDNILRFLDIVEKAALKILDEKVVDIEFFESSIGFIRNYADKIHHGKEEEYLFKEMQKYLGDLGKNLIDHGMLVEHDLARYNVLMLEKSIKEFKERPSSELMLDIITYSMGYRDLLKRHIDKENRVVYTYAEKTLDKNILDYVTKETKEFEEENFEEIKGYIEMLEKFEEKFK